jgi:hypothetical protein
MGAVSALEIPEEPDVSVIQFGQQKMTMAKSWARAWRLFVSPNVLGSREIKHSR